MGFYNVIKQGQMDTRYWNTKTERVNMHYLNSSFMGKSLAIDIFEHFDFCIDKNQTFTYFVLIGEMQI